MTHLLGCRSSEEPSCSSQGVEDNVAALVRQRLRAVELNRYTGEPVPSDVPAKIECLDKFLADPDPRRPPCQLVEDALRTSKITGA